MEKNALTFVNLDEALERFVKDFAETYKSLLIRDGKKASGNLIKSVSPLSIEFTNGKMNGYVKLADYWKYVEYGRKPGGKFPPMDKILNWIKIKPVLPRPINGIKPTEKQLAFLISRKIARDGIEAGNQYKESLDACWKKWETVISDAISKDLDSAVEVITFGLQK